MKGFAVSKDRIIKAKKIESVLNDYLNKKVTNFKILDIGAGDGFISSYFITKKNKVTCVDIEDQRIEKKAKFFKVISSKLSFKSDEFDIVISNHVIEHIKNQKLHLEEIRRVLKKDGVCYIATPNWNFPVEPHYKLPLIHYLPQKAFVKILKITKLYTESLYLLSYKEMINLFRDFTIKEYTDEVIKNPNKYSIKDNLISKLPPQIISNIKSISPTNIFILRK